MNLMILRQQILSREAKSYNLCIDSGLVGVDGAIDMILKFIELKEKNMGKDI